MLKLSSDVRDVLPKVLKLSCEVSEYKPLTSGWTSGSPLHGCGPVTTIPWAGQVDVARHVMGLANIAPHVTGLVEVLLLTS